jgi:hypothetical protein
VFGKEVRIGGWFSIRTYRSEKVDHGGIAEEGVRSPVQLLSSPGGYSQKPADGKVWAMIRKAARTIKTHSAYCGEASRFRWVEIVAVKGIAISRSGAK